MRDDYMIINNGLLRTDIDCMRDESWPLGVQV